MTKVEAEHEIAGGDGCDAREEHPGAVLDKRDFVGLADHYVCQVSDIQCH